MEIGHRVEMMPVEADFMPEPIMYSYKFYNQDMFTLLGTIGVAGLSLFYWWRFVTKNINLLMWKDVTVFVLFVLVFIKTVLEFRQKDAFQYDIGYSFMQGLSIIIGLLFLLIIRKRFARSHRPITNILDEPPL
jgi:hypothetical protein